MGRMVAARTLAGRLVQSVRPAPSDRDNRTYDTHVRAHTRSPKLSGRHSLKIMFNSDVTAPMTLTLLGLP